MSERTILGVLRFCLALWGLLWIAAGVVHVGFPELLPAEAGEPLTSRERVVFAILTLPFGCLLALSPRFFARHGGVLFVALLLALAVPVTSLLLAPMTVHLAITVSALWFFPLLMQTLLILNARSTPAA